MSKITMTKEEMHWLERERTEMVYDGREIEITADGEYTYEVSGDDDKMRDLNNQLNWYGPNKLCDATRY